MSIEKLFVGSDPELAQWLDRSVEVNSEVSVTVTQILSDVRSRGAGAVLDSARKFDSPVLESLFVTPTELEEASIEAEDLAALRTAIERVKEFHETQLGVVTNDWEELPFGWGWRTDVTDSPETGFEGQRLLPLASAGVYVPGGKASYPSSVIMNVIPAQVAGVKRVVVTTPVGPDGKIDPAVLVACRELEISEILKCGGASAVAALAFGLAGFPRVDKVVGPGNVYVNEAKRQVWGSVGLDGYAGPSEVAVVVDGSVDPAFSAADFITQVEHAEDNVGLLVALNRESLDQVLAAIETQLLSEPRADTIRRAIETKAIAVVASHLTEAIDVVNRFAPEHLSVHLQESATFAEAIINCGCVMIGPSTPQSAGDYLSGPSHTLPTSGAARFGSPVNVLDFLKIQSVTMYTPADLKSLADPIARLATLEGFPAHARGATIRGEA